MVGLGQAWVKSDIPHELHLTHPAVTTSDKMALEEGQHAYLNGGT